MLTVFIGWDEAEAQAAKVAEWSLKAHSSIPINVERISIDRVRGCGWYTRETRREGLGYWDVLSGAPMSTGHAIARFFVPMLRNYRGWALFVDGDVLFRRDVAELYAHAADDKAISVVQHGPLLDEGTKKAGHVQASYPRKNWSSVILWNCGHPSHRRLTLEMLNTLPGRDLHRFCWLADCEIGALPAEWNWLVGHSRQIVDPAIVHYTDGLPNLQPYADEWFRIAAMVPMASEKVTCSA